MSTQIPRDMELLLGDKTKEFIEFLYNALQPPSTDPIWKWGEANVQLSAANSDIPGNISFTVFPASKFFFNWAQNPRVRRITILACSQSTKTENAIILVMWQVVKNPTPTMWVMAVADQVKEFAKDRLFPAFQNCPIAFKHTPSDKKHWTATYLKFDTMSLFLRGSNSKAKLKSSPIGRIICDERDEWKPGAINTLRKRLTTFAESQEISMGVGGKKNSELHTDWLDGSQTHIHFNCLKCGHSQPWRFGKEASVIFPESRPCGGVVFDNYEVTKPGGKWDHDAVEREALFECENPECRHRHKKSDKTAMIKTAHEVHKNPKALPRHYSVLRPILMLPWGEADWGKVAVRFLKATAALKLGDMLPLMTFVQEDLGEPWEPPAARKQTGDLQHRIGSYKMGEYWMDPNDPTKRELGTAVILTFDRQLMYLRYVIRQWRKNGQSRLVYVGKATDLDHIRKIQIEQKVLDQATGGDDGGPDVSKFRMKALVYHWQVLAGEPVEHYVTTEGSGEKKRSYRQGWRKTEFDAGIGTTFQGKATKTAFLWSNSWYKDKLYFLFIRGLEAPLWEIPGDVPPDYLAEVNANELRQKELTNGGMEDYWHEVGPDHSADCELMQLVLADIGGFTRSFTQEKKQAD